MKRIASAAGLLALAFASTASAQICNGTSSFANGNMRVGANYTDYDGGGSFGGHFAYGKPASWYAGASADMTKPDGGGDGTTTLGANAGWQMALGTAKKVEFCPQAGFAIVMFPDGGTTEFSGNNFMVGGNFGTTMQASTNMDLVPFVGLAWSFMSTTAKTGTVETTATDNVGSINLGAGFVFNKVWTIQPFGRVSLDDKKQGHAFGVMGSLNFGSK